jgi:hypothetical protein
MGSSTKKSAEEMNIERRAAKKRQKPAAGAKKNKVEGFSMNDLRREGKRKENAAAEMEAKKRAVMLEGDSVVRGSGLAGAATLKKLSGFYFEVREMIAASGDYILIENAAHDQIWWWPLRVASEAKAA